MITAGIALWIGGQFFYNLNEYFQLSATAPVVLDQWNVKELKSGKFSINVNYQFEWKGQTIHGVYDFPKPIYQNPYIASEHISEWKEKSWTIWFNPKKPTVTSLQKKFPTNIFIFSAIFLSLRFLIDERS